MRYKKSKTIPTDYESFSRHYDKVYQASAHHGKASQFGFEITREGEYLAGTGMQNQLSNRVTAGFDPRYAGPSRKRPMPDVPRPESELRHDDPRFAARHARRPKPGF